MPSNLIEAARGYDKSLKDIVSPLLFSIEAANMGFFSMYLLLIV
jgi:hypothetical protein